MLAEYLANRCKIQPWVDNYDDDGLKVLSNRRWINDL